MGWSPDLSIDRPGESPCNTAGIVTPWHDIRFQPNLAECSRLQYDCSHRLRFLAGRRWTMLFLHSAIDA